MCPNVLSRNVAAQQGFTLVEIAIVLVIIGLLLGGVLKGQELIKNAQVKNYKNTVDALATGYFSYLDRYKIQPGDDNMASTRIGPPLTGAHNGNGNGTVDGNWNTTTMTDESILIFRHLYAANLLKGNALATTPAAIKPKGPKGELLGFSSASVVGLVAPVLCYGSDASNVVNVAGELAQLVDITFDDGVPNTGTWRATIPPAHATSPTAYVKTNSYGLCTSI